MPTNVGAVSVSIKLDDREAIQQLVKVRRKAEELQAALNEKRTARDSIEQQMQQTEASAERARMRVKELRAQLSAAAPGERSGIRAQLTAANADLREQTSTMDSLNRQYQKLTEEIAAGENSLDGMNNQAKTLEQQVLASKSAVAKLQGAVKQAADTMERGFQRVGRMIKRVFIFTVITRALRSLRDYFSNVLLSVPEVNQALGELKGNLLTAIQPLMNLAIPALTRLISVLRDVAAVLADIVAKVFGTTAAISQASAKALNQQAEAYKKVGTSASKASKSLASFDQINILNSNAAGSGTAGGAAATFNTDFEGLLEGKLQALELLVGEALLVLGAILAFSGVNIPLGITLMAMGAASMYAAIHSNPDELKKQIEGPIETILTIVSAALLVLGAILTFSGAKIGLGIGLMAAGAVGLVPVAVLNWDTIKGFVEDNKTTIWGIIEGVSAALLMIGLILTLSGAALPLGIGLILAGAGGLATPIAINWNAIKEKLAEAWNGITAWWSTNVAPVFTEEFWLDTLSVVTDALNTIIENATGKLKEFFAWIKGEDTGTTVNEHGSSHSSGSFGSVTWSVSPEGVLTANAPGIARGTSTPTNPAFLGTGTGTETAAGTSDMAGWADRIAASVAAAVSKAKTTAIIEVDKKELGRVTYDAYGAESRRIGGKLVEG